MTLEKPLPILIADDNPVSLKTLEMILSDAGYDVTTATNGQAAMDLFCRQFFPIVLTDWVMPEMDGLELCRAIREQKPVGYVFIMIFSAKNAKEDIIAGLGAGADDYLIKPFEGSELLARLNTAKRVLSLEASLKSAYEEVRTLSITDALTGCYNRGYLMDRLPQELKRAKRYGHPLSLLMCDIDHFKRVNDTYGHLTGDAVLKIFSRRIRDSIRVDVDWLVRYGGEEFLIVLPETPIEGAFRVVERIQDLLRERLVEIEGKEISLTASVGLTAMNSNTSEDKISPEVMISAADRYLYQAKNEGRDRVRGGIL